MGKLIDGKWQVEVVNPKNKSGEFIRQDSVFRCVITPGGAGEFPAEAGRYHLYVSYACPWAHRTLIFRKLKGLEDLISLSVVNYFMGNDGWSFNTDDISDDGSTPDHVSQRQFLREVYVLGDPHYTGRVTVPVLWDKKTGKLVCNESAEIIRMMNSAFDQLTGNKRDFYPQELRTKIDAINEKVYQNVNNGVYRIGFARTQEAYEKNFKRLFDTLDELDKILANNPFLVGDQLTEADWRLFTTLVRFDPVYVGHFKCNLRRISDYPNLSHYLRCLYQVPGVAETVNLVHIKRHYYGSHTSVNPSGIVPIGPSWDLEQPHNRDSVVLK